MCKPTHVSHPIYNLLPTEVEGFDSLAELALDTRDDQGIPSPGSRGSHGRQDYDNRMDSHG